MELFSKRCEEISSLRDGEFPYSCRRVPATQLQLQHIRNSPFFRQPNLYNGPTTARLLIYYSRKNNAHISALLGSSWARPRICVMDSMNFTGWHRSYEKGQQIETIVGPMFAN
jgi:hypothetical protein